MTTTRTSDSQRPDADATHDIQVAAPFPPCGLCGGVSTIHFYPRVGPSPGNMVVCANPECDGSAQGMKRQQEVMMRSWGHGPVMGRNDGNTPARITDG